MTVNNFFSSVDGQLELLAQATLDSAVSNAGALHALRPRLGCFHQLLLEPPEVGRVLGGRGGSPGVRAELGQEPSPALHLQLEPLRTTWGSLAPPLGNTRLHVVKLLASALSANDAALTQELLALDVPNTMLVLGAKGRGVGGGGGTTPGELLRASLCPHPQDLFFHYVFNNFLHAQVEVCVSTMLSSGPPADSGSDTPPENPVVKHVSWAPGSRSPLLSGGLCSGSPPACHVQPDRSGAESWSLLEVQSLGKQCRARVGTGGVVTSGAVDVRGGQEGFSQGDGPSAPGDAFLGVALASGRSCSGGRQGGSGACCAG